MLINGLGAITTAITVVVVIISKFSEGAWVTLILIPGLIFLMRNVRHHYDRTERETASRAVLSTEGLRPPLVVVPLDRWDNASEKALRLALIVSPDVVAVHIDSEEGSNRLSQEEWRSCVEEPTQRAGLPTPKLVVLKSPYRFIVTPILNFVFELERKHTDRQIAVFLPTLVERHWYEHFLHNQYGELLTALLLLKGNKRIVIVNIPWYLNV